MKILENLLEEIVGESVKKSRIIKINSDDLSSSGDLCFSANLKAWRNICKNNNINNTDRNILEYYLRRHNVDTKNLSDEKIQDEALKRLLVASRRWILSIDRAFLQKEKVCLFLNRSTIVAMVVKNAVKSERLYGRILISNDKSIYLRINEDTASELTTVRLKQLKHVCDNILIAQGYRVNEDNANYRYFLTTKSQGIIDDDFNKYICGVVKNPETNSKDTSRTFADYLMDKIEEIRSINASKLPNSEYREIWLKTIAEAVIIFEFLSVKPSQPVIINTTTPTTTDVNKGVVNNKGGAFVLYNYARITTMLNKFREEQLAENYPELWDIETVDFDKLALEEEWNLIYNFILNYPTVLLNSVQHHVDHELCPQILCSFLSQLSHKFSIYYRHTRILTEGREHLLPTMMARLYLLKALQIIMNNVLEFLNIVPISRM